MSDFKYHINHRFGGCRLIARALDPHRDREVKLYHLPGNFEYVGVSDGVDAWIAPVVVDPFAAAVGRQLERIRNGQEIVTVVDAGPGPRIRKRVSEPLLQSQPSAAVVRERRRVPSA